MTTKPDALKSYQLSYYIEYHDPTEDGWKNGVQPYVIIAKNWSRVGQDGRIVPKRRNIPDHRIQIKHGPYKSAEAAKEALPMIFRSPVRLVETYGDEDPDNVYYRVNPLVLSAEKSADIARKAMEDIVDYYWSDEDIERHINGLYEAVLEQENTLLDKDAALELASGLRDNFLTSWEEDTQVERRGDQNIP